MSRVLVVAAAQLGPIPRSQPREEAVARLVAMMEEARRMGANLVVYPEAALTAFFPHWWIEDEAELDSWFEREMPNAATRPLFEAARRLRVGFKLGYCELDFSTGRKRRFNTAILVDRVSRFQSMMARLPLRSSHSRRSAARLRASSMSRMASAGVSLSTVSCTRRRDSAAMVVSRNWSGFISPSPLKR